MHLYRQRTGDTCKSHPFAWYIIRYTLGEYNGFFILTKLRGETKTGALSRSSCKDIEGNHFDKNELRPCLIWADGNRHDRQSLGRREGAYRFWRTADSIIVLPYTTLVRSIYDLLILVMQFPQLVDK
ncbi:hypothetical protein KM043_015982 [Ampulex compressa]|nr:hypothetical protein KM043_015982 [Ampulex compressa]